MADFSIEEIRDTAMENLTDLGQIAKTGLQSFCQLADDFGGAVGFGQRDYATAIGMGELYTKMCGPGPSTNPKRIPPGLPSTGQCFGSKYNVSFQVDEYYQADDETRPIPRAGLDVYGPIDRVYADGFGDYVDPTTQNRYAAFSSVKVVCRGTSTPLPGAPPVTVTIISSSTPKYVDLRDVSITVYPGFSDSCGTKPVIEYPPVKDRPPVQIPGPDGPIIVRPTIPPVVVNPTVNFSPTVNVNLGPFNLNFSLGGVNILIPNLSTGPITIGPGTPGTNPAPAPSPVNIGDSIFYLNGRIKNLRLQLDRLKQCVCDGEPPYDSEQLFSNVQSGCYTLLPKDRNRFCAVNIIQTPTNPKNQPGGSAPDVLYCGWAWFHTEQGQATERMPIDAFGKIFENTGRYGVFCFTLYEGYRANVFGLHVPLDWYTLVHTNPPED